MHEIRGIHTFLQMWHTSSIFLKILQKQSLKVSKGIEFIVRAIFFLMSLISASFLPLRAVFTSGKQKRCLVCCQVCKLNGWSAPQSDLPGKPFTVRAEWARTLSCKRNQLFFSQNCGLTLEVHINNLSNNCI
jgi:hypothetical protein